MSEDEGKKVTEFKVGGLPVSSSDLLKGLQGYQQTITESGGYPFLKLQKDGIFVYGQEDTEIEEGSLWAMNPLSLEHGWACWHESELIGEQMVPFMSPRPNRAELPELGHEWAEQKRMMLMCLNGEDKGLEVVYKTTAKGFANAVKELTTALIEQIATDEAHPVPILKLETDSYKHKDYGKIYTPVFGIERWSDFKGVTIKTDAKDESDDDKHDDAKDESQEEAPPSRRRRAS